METTTTLGAYQFSELLRKIDPHIGRHSGYSGIQGVRLDSDGRYLHAVATDRYTVAVARQRLRSNDPTWALTIRTAAVEALTAWINTTDAEANIHLSPGPEGLTVTTGQATFVIPAIGGHFPDWRGMVRTAIDHEGTASTYSSFQTALLARWEKAGRTVNTWQAAFDKPLVVYGHNFVGLQMPYRIPDSESPSARRQEWADSLGEGAPVAQEETLNHWEPEELAERENVVPEAVEDLLKQVLRSTSDLFEAADSAALAAYALSGCRAWLAYRLLKALEKADPDLLRTTVLDANEQLEDGAISEWAWDEAEAAGYNPQQWHDDYEAHLEAHLEARRAKVEAS